MNRPIGRRAARRAVSSVVRPLTEALEPRRLLASDVIISEFLALNTGATPNSSDNYGDKSDWIELYNPTAEPVSLLGWRLTDDAGELDKWVFPDVTLGAGQFLRVWASDRNDRDPGQPLHTNFKLSGDGEYLALSKPDGTITTEFDPFPAQRSDVSYGMPQGVVNTTLVAPGANARILIPDAASDLTNWTARTGFDHSSWLQGPTGIGYDTDSTFDPLIATDVEQAMRGRTASALIRIPFTVTDPSIFNALTLRIKYEDGFAAFLNGVFIGARNAPAGAPGTLAWDSASPIARNEAQAVVYEDVPVPPAALASLVAGTNVLAIHGLNGTNANSTDFLIVPELVGSGTAAAEEVYGYLQTPTPGSTNAALATNAGPIIENVTEPAQALGDDEDLTITATVIPAPHAVDSVVLRYRVNYDPEQFMVMFDDGLHGDGAAGDGVFGATIPARVAGPGQMLRWAVTATDALGNASRAPVFAEPTKSPEYYGTMVADPAVTSTLPIYYWWTQNPSAATTRTGTRASVFYNGKFYDNVFVRDRGGNSTDGYKFDFNPGFRFQWMPGGRKVDEVDLNYNSGIDETLIRPVISYGVFNDVGVPAPAAFPVRLQLNGAFQRMAYFSEVPDEDFLERQGLDGNGALYKITVDRPQMTNANDYEKKTRRDEDNSDLQAFLDGIHQTGQARINFLYDNFDIMSFLNYQAANTLVNDNDHVQKNYFLYRDTEGDGRWRFLPWDKDLTLGKHWGLPDYNAADRFTHPFFGDSDHPKVDGAHAYNYLIDLLLDIPEIKEMYLRRLRSVMDEFLQQASTPYEQRYFEQRLDEVYAQIAGDPTVLASRPNLLSGINNIKDLYLTKRRNHLFVNHTNPDYSDSAKIPGPQPAGAVIEFGTIDFNPVSGNQEEEFIELRNPNPYAVDVSGWVISGGIDHVLAKGTVIPAGGSIYLSPNVAAFRARTTGPRGGQGLLVVGPYKGDQLSAYGETLVLTNAAGAQVASVTFGPAPTVYQQSLRITEVMVHPADAPGNMPVDEDFEYVELKNISAQPLDLAGVQFTQGIDFTFPSYVLQPGAYVLVVRNLAAFESRYGPGLPVAGEYLVDALSNGGAPLQLKDPAGEEILDFNYNVRSGVPGVPDTAWYPSTDGLGRSLVILDPDGPPESWDLKESWRPSPEPFGSPGTAGAAPDLVAPTLTLSVAPASHRSSLDALTLTFSEPVYGLELSDLALTRDGEAVAWTGAEVLTPVPGSNGAAYTLTGLEGATSRLGAYTVALAAGASITDLVDNPLAGAPAPVGFVVDTIAGTPDADTLRLVRDGVDPGLVHVFLNAPPEATTPTYSYLPATVPTVRFDAGGGDDVLTLADAALAYAYLPGDGADTLELAGGTHALPLDMWGAERLTIGAGAAAHLAAGTPGVVRLGGLSIAPSGRLDLGEHLLALDVPAASRAQALADLTPLLRSALLGNPSWTGPGLGSSAAGADLTLAAVVNDRGDGTAMLGSFAGQALAPSLILVTLAAEGDLNLDGRVDAADYFRIDRGRALGLGTYGDGDLDYSGQAADVDDYLALDLAFMRGVSQGSATSAPEAPAAPAAPSPAGVFASGGVIADDGEDEEDEEGVVDELLA